MTTLSSLQPRENILSAVFRRRPNLTVFATNFCIMTLELVAGRLIAPFVGVSLYTWTAVIGIVLAGMTLGNWLGGTLSDRWPNWRLVGIALTGAGLTSLFSLFIIAFSAEAIANIPLPYVLAVVAITIVFFFPSMFLGMVSPAVAKLTVHDLTTTGNVVGKIYASAAMGSIFGTYVTGFWLISILGTRAIIVTVAALLLIMALAFLDLEEWRFLSRRNKTVVLTLLIVLVGGATFAWARDVCFKESHYYCIRVDTDDNGAVKVMRLNRLIHSFTDLTNPENLVYSYERVFATLYEDARTSLAPADQPKILFLGGGAYTLPRYLVHRYGDPQGVVTEIDPMVSEVAFSEFDMPRDSSLTTANIDARIFMRDLPPAEVFDLIFGDAFSDYSIPYHLTTKEFTQSLSDHLSSDGVYAANVIDNLDPGLFVFSYLRTLEAVFPHTYLIRTQPDAQDYNRQTLVLAASKQPLSETAIKEKAKELGYEADIDFFSEEELAGRLSEQQRITLTDDFAPVDNLIAPLFVNRR